MACCLRTNITPNTILEIEFKIPEYSKECEMVMIDTISEFKGVESCEPDAENQKIAVSGSFSLENLVKKLMKKTGKEMDIVIKQVKDRESEIVQKKDEKLGSLQEKFEEEKRLETVLEEDEKTEFVEPNSDVRKDIDNHMMLNEHNLDAKCIIS